MALLPNKGRTGSTPLGRMGDVFQQPPFWVGVAGVLAWAGGPRGRRAALRGSACYAASAIAANVVIKPFVGRSRPPGAGRGRPGPVTSSFPSGHAATELAFVFGASQELPALFAPLAATTVLAHWSLVRSGGHYPSDVVVGGAVGIAIAAAAWKLWPVREASGENPAHRQCDVRRPSRSPGQPAALTEPRRAPGFAGQHPPRPGAD